MDMFQKLSEVKDLNLQALLTHAIRSALTHNLVATQAAATEDNPQAMQAAAMHKETSIIMNALVDFAIAAAEKVEPVVEDAPKPPKSRKKTDN